MVDKEVEIKHKLCKTKLVISISKFQIRSKVNWLWKYHEFVFGILNFGHCGFAWYSVFCYLKFFITETRFTLTP